MKEITIAVVMVLIVSVLGACAPETPQPDDGLIEPGDKIGDFLITTGDDEGVTYMSLIHCPVSGQTETCELPVGTKVNVSNSLFDPDGPGGKSLDDVWAEHTYEMAIDGRPVNLPAFGSIETRHPVVGTLRNWNVVVVADKPGTVTVDFSSVVNGDPYAATFVVVFTAQ